MYLSWLISCVNDLTWEPWRSLPEGKEPGLECSCPWAVKDSGRFLLELGFMVLTTAWRPSVEGRFWILLWFLQNCRRWSHTCLCGVVSHGTFYQELRWRFGWACLGTCSHLFMCSLIRITSVVSSAMALEPLFPLPLPFLFWTELIYKLKGDPYGCATTEPRKKSLGRDRCLIECLPLPLPQQPAHVTDSFADCLVFVSLKKKKKSLIYLYVHLKYIHKMQRKKSMYSKFIFLLK